MLPARTGRVLGKEQGQRYHIDPPDLEGRRSPSHIALKSARFDDEFACQNNLLLYRAKCMVICQFYSTETQKVCANT